MGKRNGHWKTDDAGRGSPCIFDGKREPNAQGRAEGGGAGQTQPGPRPSPHLDLFPPGRGQQPGIRRQDRENEDKSAHSKLTDGAKTRKRARE